MESEWIFGRWGRTPPLPPRLSPLCGGWNNVTNCWSPIIFTKFDPLRLAGAPKLLISWGFEDFVSRVPQRWRGLNRWYLVFRTYEWNFSGRTEHEFGVIFFVFLSTFFGNLEVCDVKTCNIFWKYMSATWSTCLCLDHYFIGGLFNCPYILCPYMGVKCMGNETPHTSKLPKKVLKNTKIWHRNEAPYGQQISSHICEWKKNKIKNINCTS